MKYEYLKTDDGKERANEFILAMEDGRVFTITTKPYKNDSVAFSVKEISKSGKYIYQFDHPFSKIGFKTNKKGNVVANGGGMDLIYQTLHVAMNKLEENGFLSKERKEKINYSVQQL